MSGCQAFDGIGKNWYLEIDGIMLVKPVELLAKGTTMSELARFLIIAGLILLVVGVVLLIAPKIPWLGKLPGDITWQRGRFTLYFPLGTCILISVILTLIFTLFRR